MTRYFSVHTVHITAVQCDTIPASQKIFDVNVQLCGALGERSQCPKKKEKEGQESNNRAGMIHVCAHSGY